MSKAETLLKEIGQPPSDSDRPDLLRVLLLCYLVDWKSAVDMGRPLTDSDWQRAAWGPVSKRILAALFRDEPATDLSDLTDKERAVISFVLRDWKSAKLDDLRKMASSTYPLIVSRPGESLNLSALAEIYRTDFSTRKSAAEA